MADTNPVGGTSDGKLCLKCESPIEGDQRYSRCETCRQVAPPMPKTAEQADPEVFDGAGFESSPSMGIEPIKLDVKAYAPPPIEDRDFYWCGAAEDCPMDITLGGFEFPKSIGRLVESETGKFQVQGGWKPGIVHPLTEAQKNVVLEHAANKVIRNYRKTADGRHLGDLKGITGNKRRIFTPHPTDKPLGHFVYMIRVRHSSDRPFDNPPTMVERNW